MKNSIDKSNIREDILTFPKQFKVGIEAAKNIKIEGDFDNIVVSGMGGSAWPTDVLTAWLNLPIPLYVNRTYNLPLQATKKTLAIFSSYSGNTEEPIFSYREALQRKLSSVMITSGGELKELCQKDNTPLALIPSGFQPRMATGYLLSALAGVLFKAGLIGEKSIEKILSLEEKLKPQDLENKGKEIAEKLFNKIPVIYAPDRLRAISYVWKIKFNENSKVPSFCNYLSELNHNEINGWENSLGNFSVIILRDTDDHPRMRKRVEFTAELLKSRKVEVEIIDMPKGDSLEKILNTIILGDWASYHLALKYGTDPAEIKIVDELKEKLKEN